MSHARSPLPPEILSGPFTVSRAHRLGVSSKRLRGADLGRPIRGVRLPPGSDGLAARCLAFAEHRKTDFMFSHTTAAALYGVPLPFEDATIHVTVPGAGRAPSIRGYAGHTLGRWEKRAIAGFPVTTPEQTWIDLAQELERDALVAAGDYLVGGPHPLTTVAQLASFVESSRRRRGVTLAREAVTLVRVGAESPGETRLRLRLSDAGLPAPRLNYDLCSANGTFVARIDLAYPEQRIALEYEGDMHRVEKSIWRKDIRRRERVEDLGWRMVRVTADDIAAPAELIARIRSLLRRNRG